MKTLQSDNFGNMQEVDITHSDTLIEKTNKKMQGKFFPAGALEEFKKEFADKIECEHAWTEEHTNCTRCGKSRITTTIK